MKNIPLLQQKMSVWLTPQMQQAIHMLQLTNLEILDMLREQAFENPFLNVEAPSPSSPKLRQERRNDSDDMLSDLAAPDMPWREALLQQVRISFAKDAMVQKVAPFLVESISEDGYFRENLQSLSQSIKIPYEQVEETLEKLKTLEPLGIFSQNLQEFFTKVLKHQNQLTESMERLLSHLHLLTKLDFNGVAKKCRFSLETLRELLAQIRQLPLGPVSQEQQVAALDIPDLLLVEKEPGAWTIEMNAEILPKVVLEKGYFETTVSLLRDEDEKKFCQERFRQAKGLSRGFEQRSRTILKVAKEVLLHQQDFITHGERGIKPLTLKEIAETTELHESTVSRVVANKTILTPQGLVLLKKFFNSALGVQSHGASNVSDMSSAAVKFEIRKLVSGERGTLPLSDDQLTILLKSKGLKIARRTVTKYRESLNIPSSHQRRRQSQFMGK